MFVIYWYWHEVDQNEYPTVFGCFQGYWQIDGLLVGGIESLSLKLCLVVIRLSFFMQYSIWCWHSWHLINNDSCFSKAIWTKKIHSISICVWIIDELNINGLYLCCMKYLILLSYQQYMLISILFNKSTYQRFSKERQQF